jgi:hypothetical protein
MSSAAPAYHSDQHKWYAGAELDIPYETTKHEPCY